MTSDVPHDSLAELSAQGVAVWLERDGITKFENSWNELSTTLATELHRSRNATRS